MEQHNYGNETPVCGVCGAIGTPGDRHCRYCGADLTHSSKLDPPPISIHRPESGYQERRQRPTSEAFRRGAQIHTSQPQVSTDHRAPDRAAQDLLLAILAIALGGLSLLMLIFSRQSFLFALAAVILGIVSLFKNAQGQGLSIVGICLGGFVILANIFWWFSSIFFMIF